MKKTVSIIVIVVGIASLLYILKYFNDANSKEIVDFEVEKPFRGSIHTKVVATGKLIPEEEIEVKPQIPGIIDKIHLEEGDIVKKGDLIATIRVVPNEQALVGASSRIKTSKLSFENSKVRYQRDKTLFEKGVISKQDFENSELNYSQAKENLAQAQNDYQIIKRGSISGGGTANTSIVAQIPGTLLEIPVREGNQVIESNSFNAGTTIATIADMSKMIFEGKVDETEVGKLEEGTNIKVVLGAIGDKDFPAKLIFVAPKGKELNGAVQFVIKAEVMVQSSKNIRAGYSANAEIALESKDDILCIKEALLQFDRDTEKPFVEVRIGDDEYEKRDIVTGLSDGINIEIIEGVTLEDEIKIWNEASEEEEEGDE